MSLAVGTAPLLLIQPQLSPGRAWPKATPPHLLSTRGTCPMSCQHSHTLLSPFHLSHVLPIPTCSPHVHRTPDLCLLINLGP